MQVLGFYITGILGLTRYMSVKYGKQWEDYKRRVPYAIIPGIV
jgi:protein-S-isoprenylcysteine O-methyltransferase Ste14